MEKERKKNPNRAIVIAVWICVGVVLVILAAILLVDPLTAASRRKETVERLEQSGEVRVVLTDPLQGGEGLFSAAELTLVDQEAELLRNELLSALRNSRFDEVEKVNTGVWKISATVYIGQERTVLYLEEEQICLERDGKLTFYELEDNAEESYEAIYKSIRNRLNQIQ